MQATARDVGANKKFTRKATIKEGDPEDPLPTGSSTMSRLPPPQRVKHCSASPVIGQKAMAFEAALRLPLPKLASSRR
jgi:hypothetical protein